MVARRSTFSSPNGMSFNMAVPAGPPNGNAAPQYIQSQSPDIGTVRVFSSSNYDTSANPLRIGSIYPSLLFFVKNEQATAFKVVGPTALDPGVLVAANSTTFIGSDGTNMIDLSGEGGSILPPLPTGGDDGANITAALAADGVVTLRSGATYNIATPITMTGFQTLNINGAFLKGAMAASGTNANSVIFGSYTLGSVSTTVSAAPVIGANTITVTSATGITSATFIEIANSLSANVFGVYRVVHVAGTTLTLERPISYVFDAAATVKSISSPSLENVNIIGPCLISGTGDAGIYIKGGYLQYIERVRVSPSLGNLVRGIVLEGCVNSEVNDSQVDGFNTTSNTDVFDTGIAFLSCDSCYAFGDWARNCTVTGLFMRDCTGCRVQNCEGSGCLTGGGAGIAVSGTSAASSFSLDCVVQNCLAADNDIGVGVALATQCRFLGVTSRGNVTNNWSIGTAGTASTDCTFDGMVSDGGACASGGVLVDAAVVRPTFLNVLCKNQTGAANVFIGNPDFRMIGFTSLSTNTTTGIVLVTGGAAGDTFVTNVNITMKTVNAAAVGIEDIKAAGRLYLKNVVIALGVANDQAISQQTSDILELDDVMVTNPGGGGGTKGISAVGATSVTRRKGRVDFAATATPFTLVQADQGTVVSNNNNPVDTTFKDIRAGAFIGLTLFTPGGTPGFGHTITITGATKFTFTGTNLDTSTYQYKILD